MKNTAITLYGIRNCDTVRKARQWLEDHGQPCPTAAPAPCGRAESVA